MNRIFALLLTVVLALLPHSAFGQRFGGRMGGAAGLWLVYILPDVETDRSFDRDVGNVVGLGARVFVQIERVRIGGGGFGGTFTSKGLNPDGNEVSGGVSGGGLMAEYLLVQQNFEVSLGGMAGGGVVTIEEQLAVTGEVERLNRREDDIFIGLPWVRLGYNPTPFVNVGLQLGYFIGTDGFDGFTTGIDIMVGLIP